MSFDMQVYSQIFDAIGQILNRNMNVVGRDFAQQFGNEYDPRINQQTMSNAQNLNNWVWEQARRLNGGNERLNVDQLHEIVGSFIKGTFDDFVRSQQQRSGVGYGNGGFSSFGGGGFASQTGFGNNGGFGMSNRPRAGSHVMDDTIQQQRQPASGSRPPSAPPARPEAPVSAPMASPIDLGASYSVNPLDEFPDNIRLNKVTSRSDWGGEAAKDKRIIITTRDDLKTGDTRFSVTALNGIHQIIQNNPLDVLKDFYAVVPDNILGSPFTAKIMYNHLETVEIPTKNFLELRQECMDAVASDHNAVLHKTLMKVVGNMPVSLWRAMSGYLLRHINRALYLAARVSTNVKAEIQIDEFEDLETLLSSNFQHELVIKHTNGRASLERIVSAAIWNALVMNSDVMFEDDIVPANAMQSSPSFPFSMDGVYPSKSAIPTKDDPQIEAFLTNLQQHELAQRSYILSRRAVVITNTLGKKVLPAIQPVMTRIDNPVAAMLNDMIIPYTQVQIDARDGEDRVKPYILEDYASDQLERYYENPSDYDQETVDRLGRERSTRRQFPVEQTIFAVQYGKSPLDYLMALEVFSTIDAAANQSQAYLAKKTIPTIKTTA